MQNKTKTFLLGCIFRWRAVAIVCVVVSGNGFASLSRHLILNIVLQALVILASGFVVYTYRTLDIFFQHRRLLTDSGLEILDAGILAKEALSTFDNKLFGLYVDWQYSRCTCYGTLNQATGKMASLFQLSDSPCPVHNTSYSPMVDLEPFEVDDGSPCRV